MRHSITTYNLSVWLPTAQRQTFAFLGTLFSEYNMLWGSCDVCNKTRKDTNLIMAGIICDYGMEKLLYNVVFWGGGGGGGGGGGCNFLCMHNQTKTRLEKNLKLIFIRQVFYLVYIYDHVHGYKMWLLANKNMHNNKYFWTGIYLIHTEGNQVTNNVSDTTKTHCDRSVHTSLRGSKSLGHCFHALWLYEVLTSGDTTFEHFAKYMPGLWSKQLTTEPTLMRISVSPSLTQWGWVRMKET